MLLSVQAVIAVFFPLCGFLITGGLSQKISDKTAQMITVGLMIPAALAGLSVCFSTCGQGVQAWVPLFCFLDVGQLSVSWGLCLDPLSGFMMGVVTCVSLFVHIYSIGYMEREEGVPRFMAYLSLFTFFMLALVTSSSLLQLFFGWEGVGLASYLLIGFFFKKESACDASMKAFLVNRVGDVGYVVGMALVFLFVGSLNFSDLLPQAAFLAHQSIALPWGGFVPVTEAISFAFFVGAMGKSAQIGLHVWLPDAMEGPTPVSALIHAATMVTAGVFLMARLSPVLEYAPCAKTFILYTGALTALMAATIACVQYDIKRVVAYSTCSQLGYMFMSIGAGAYDAALFHLATHAFFKALLFLTCGSIIHSFSGAQDMREMGGCYRTLPWAYGAMWVGNLALAGLPFFAGFYSKEAIIAALWSGHSQASDVAFYASMIGVFLTAFYSWRLLFSVFHGPEKASEVVKARLHESAWVMRGPLVILCFAAIVAGYVFQHFFLGASSMWNGSLVQQSGAHEAPWFFFIFPTSLTLLGIIAAVWLHQLPAAFSVPKLFAPLHRFLTYRWYIDWLYEKIFVTMMQRLAPWSWSFIDRGLIDRVIVRNTQNVAQSIARSISCLQTGYLHHYVTFLAAGAVSLLVLGAVTLWGV